MKTLFQDNQIEGLMLFSDKSNWTKILVFVKEIVNPEKFFFFFDSERGNHLNIFVTHFQENQIDLINNFLNTLPKTQEFIEDPLFKNAPQNSIHPIQMLPKSFDIEYDDFIKNEEFKTFLSNLSSVTIGALQYNDFFLEEKNRVNFALQLIFIALVRANKNQIIENLYSLFGNRENEISNQSPLLGFYKDIQLIEMEENIETWVKDWLDVSESFLQKATFQTMVEAICLMLEIRSFSVQLLLTTFFVLTKTND